jgi:hypothetical protein
VNIVSIATNQVEVPNNIAQRPLREIQTITFDAKQAALLNRLSGEIAFIGGPQSVGAAKMAVLAAIELRLTFSVGQSQLVEAYSNGNMSMLVFEGLHVFSQSSAPNELPPLSVMESRNDVACMASRNQILLHIVDCRAFAYDIDNDGKITRLVANFKGGGLNKLSREPKTVELSSHAGILLGPHTEAPYWCSIRSENGHSPQPSALVLSALWNPKMEPTSVIALHPILHELGAINCLALTSKNFNFTRSDSFVGGKGTDGKNVSILDLNENFGFAVRFNSYRFNVNNNATAFVKSAFEMFRNAISRAVTYHHVLTQESAIIINNDRALHCRDIVKDNRRLLVRLFGMAKYATPVVISNDPLLLRG